MIAPPSPNFCLLVQRLRMAPAGKGALLRLHYYYYYYTIIIIIIIKISRSPERCATRPLDGAAGSAEGSTGAAGGGATVGCCGSTFSTPSAV